MKEVVASIGAFLEEMPSFVRSDVMSAVQRHALQKRRTSRPLRVDEVVDWLTAPNPEDQYRRIVTMVGVLDFVMLELAEHNSAQLAARYFGGDRGSKAILAGRAVPARLFSRSRERWLALRAGSLATSALQRRSPDPLMKGAGSPTP